MKKVLSLLMVFLLLFSGNVFAGSAEEVAALIGSSAKTLSASGKISFSTTLNQPLEFIKTIPTDEEVDIDYQLLIESLIGATSEIEYAYEISEDRKKMDMSLSMVFDTPIALNESFRIDAWSKVDAWLQYDVTDLNHPVYQIIVKVPFVKKYMVMDYSGMVQANPIIPLLDATSFEQVQKEMMDALLRHAKVQKKGLEYQISLNDADTREYLMESLALLKTYLEINNSQNMESYLEMENDIQDISDVVKNTSFIGDKGLTVNVVKNAKGLLSAEIEKLHLNFNIYDILSLYGKSTEGLSREQGAVDLMLETSVTFENHNKTKVTFPQLTDDNSEIVSQYYGAFGTSFVAKKPPVFQNNCVYYPLETIAEQINAPLQIDKTEEGYQITYFDDRVLVVSGNSVIYNGEEDELEIPPVVYENNEFYCMEQLVYPLNISSVFLSYDTKKENFYISFEVFAEDDSHPMEEYDDKYVYEDEEYTYIPMTLHYSFYLDRNLYQENQILFVPVYEFISMLFAGEFSYGEHSITYTATEENLFDIHAFSATANDMFVTINGEQYPLQQKVTEVDGVLNIPVSFAKTLGLSGDAQISQSFESENITSVCRFYMDNPEYKDETWNYEEDNFETFKYLYFWVNSDQVPCVKNDEVYVPLYDLLLEMYDGEFTFFENGLEYLATGENPLGMKKVSAFLDDNFVTVDDKKISFDNKIIEENDIIRVPLSFTTKLGMKTEGISTYYGTSYSFSMENPAYIPPLEDDIEVNHWFYHLF